MSHPTEQDREKARESVEDVWGELNSRDYNALLERVAQAIADAREQENEACAKVCDEQRERYVAGADHASWSSAMRSKLACEDCATAIRARTQEGKP